MINISGEVMFLLLGSTFSMGLLLGAVMSSILRHLSASNKPRHIHKARPKQHKRKRFFIGFK